MVPCPIRTLVLFRRDGEDALTGSTKDYYAAAVGRGLDVRVRKYEQRELGSLLAFPRWLQAIKPDVEAAGKDGPPRSRRLSRNSPSNWSGG